MPYPDPQSAIFGLTEEGVHVVHAAPFAYNTAGLNGGIVAPFNDGWRPTIGEILHDAWVSILTAWNGTTPKGEVGQFLSGATTGLWTLANGAVLDMTTADAAPAGHGILTNGSASNPNLMATNSKTTMGRRGATSRFSTTDPIKICVSTTGAPGGAATGATAGSAVLYVVTSRPA